MTPRIDRPALQAKDKESDASEFGIGFETVKCIRSEICLDIRLKRVKLRYRLEGLV